MKEYVKHKLFRKQTRVSRSQEQSPPSGWSTREKVDCKSHHMLQTFGTKASGILLNFQKKRKKKNFLRHLLFLPSSPALSCKPCSFQSCLGETFPYKRSPGGTGKADGVGFLAACGVGQHGQWGAQRLVPSCGELMKPAEGRGCGEGCKLRHAREEPLEPHTPLLRPCRSLLRAVIVSGVPLVLLLASRLPKSGRGRALRRLTPPSNAPLAGRGAAPRLEAPVLPGSGGFLCIRGQCRNSERPALCFGASRRLAADA